MQFFFNGGFNGVGSSSKGSQQNALRSYSEFGLWPALVFSISASVA